MVFVKVRETYDLHTTRNKMTVIAIHTPKPDIIKRNYPGLLMQCKAYRPVKADVRLACAQMLPADIQGVGLAEGDIAPEDVFNPILYKAMSNFGMSQLEARINYLAHNRPSSSTAVDVDGSSATVDVDTVTSSADEFNIYYGLLSETHNWKHAHPQQGLSMSNLKPLVWEMLYNVGDNSAQTSADNPSLDVTRPEYFDAPSQTGFKSDLFVKSIRGNAKPMPFINTTSFSRSSSGGDVVGVAATGFPYNSDSVASAEVNVPSLNVVVGAIVVAPSRLHELFYRMVVEWTLEFSAIRSLADITDWSGLARLGDNQHYQNYDYSATKEVVTGNTDTLLDSDACMVSANVEVTKVM